VRNGEKGRDGGEKDGREERKVMMRLEAEMSTSYS
jgi:hypothetical protein